MGFYDEEEGLGSQIQIISDSDEDSAGPSSASKRKRKASSKGGLDLADFLPTSKRSQVAKKYGTRRQGLGCSDLEDDDENTKERGAAGKAQQGVEESDSDIELIEEEDRQRQKKEAEKRCLGGAAVRVPVSDQDFANRQLLARSKARLAALSRVGEEEDTEEEEEDLEVEEEDDEQAQDDSGDGAEESLVPSPSPAAKSPAGGPKKRLQVKVVDGRRNEMTARVRYDRPLEELLAWFEKKAAESSWMLEGTTGVIYKFDGDTLERNATPADLDLEDGDVIEAYYTLKKK